MPPTHDEECILDDFNEQLMSYVNKGSDVTLYDARAIFFLRYQTLFSFGYAQTIAKDAYTRNIDRLKTMPKYVQSRIERCINRLNRRNIPIYRDTIRHVRSGTTRRTGWNKFIL